MILKNSIVLHPSPKMIMNMHDTATIALFIVKMFSDIMIFTTTNIQSGNSVNGIIITTETILN